MKCILFQKKISLKNAKQLLSLTQMSFTLPNTIVDFLKVSLQVQSLSPEERESLQFMLDEIDKAGKK